MNKSVSLLRCQKQNRRCFSSLNNCSSALFVFYSDLEAFIVKTEQYFDMHEDNSENSNTVSTAKIVIEKQYHSGFGAVLVSQTAKVTKQLFTRVLIPSLNIWQSFGSGYSGVTTKSSVFCSCKCPLRKKLSTSETGYLDFVFTVRRFQL